MKKTVSLLLALLLLAALWPVSALADGYKYPVSGAVVEALASQGITAEPTELGFGSGEAFFLTCPTGNSMYPEITLLVTVQEGVMAFIWWSEWETDITFEEDSYLLKMLNDLNRDSELAYLRCSDGRIYASYYALLDSSDTRDAAQLAEKAGPAFVEDLAKAFPTLYLFTM